LKCNGILCVLCVDLTLRTPRAEENAELASNPGLLKQEPIVPVRLQTARTRCTSKLNPFAIYDSRFTVENFSLLGYRSTSRLPAYVSSFLVIHNLTR
jgi:hypothetical protein